MLLIFLRAIILYTLVLLVMRCMGKREIGQLQPFELAISIMIADLAIIPMSELGTPIFYGVVPILALLVMHILISYINLKSIKFREFICGKPSILVYRGKIDEKVMKKENFTINEKIYFKCMYKNCNHYFTICYKFTINDSQWRDNGNEFRLKYFICYRQEC